MSREAIGGKNVHFELLRWRHCLSVTIYMKSCKFLRHADVQATWSRSTNLRTHTYKYSALRNYKTMIINNLHILN